MSDVLVVSLGGTAGLRNSDEELVASLRRAGATVALAQAERPRDVRTFALTDLGWARATRRAARAALTADRPRAILYSTTTAALLWPEPGAIRFDAPAAATRPGRHGIWQRPFERRRLREASLLVPMSEAGLEEAGGLLGEAPVVVVPIPVEPSAAPTPTGERDIAAITYGANPSKKGIDVILGAWETIRREDEELVVAGTSESWIERDGVRVTGHLDPADYRSLVRRARVFISAPRREDYGIAQLEALADGCVLVTTAPAGPYVALEIARRLDARLVGGELATAIRTALDDPVTDYAERALDELRPLRREAVDAVVRERLLPALLA